MIATVLGVLRRLRLTLWAFGVRLRLRRLGVRAEISIASGVRFESLPLLETDPYSPSTRGGTLSLRVGRDVRLGRALTLDLRLGTDNVLVLGDRAVVQSWCRLQLHGGSIEVGRDSHLRDLVQLKTKSTRSVGDRAVLARGTAVHATAGVTIGDDCGIGERTSIIDSDHHLDGIGTSFLQAPLRAEPILVGRGVAVGANCVILPGSRLGDGAALAAGGVLAGAEVPAGHLAGGVPARVLKDLRA